MPAPVLTACLRRRLANPVLLQRHHIRARVAQCQHRQRAAAAAQAQRTAVQGIAAQPAEQLRPLAQLTLPQQGATCRGSRVTAAVA